MYAFFPDHAVDSIQCSESNYMEDQAGQSEGRLARDLPAVNLSPHSAFHLWQKVCQNAAIVI